MTGFQKGDIVRCIDPGGAGNNLRTGNLYRVTKTDDYYIRVEALVPDGYLPRNVFTKRFEKL